jgi:hypothetical protein
MHSIIDKKFYLGPESGTLFNKKWITISELLHCACPEEAPHPFVDLLQQPAGRIKDEELVYRPG